MDGKTKSALIFPHKLLAESKVQMILKRLFFWIIKKIEVFKKSALAPPPSGDKHLLDPPP